MKLVRKIRQRHPKRVANAAGELGYIVRDVHGFFWYDLGTLPRNDLVLLLAELRRVENAPPARAPLTGWWG